MAIETTRRRLDSTIFLLRVEVAALDPFGATEISRPFGVVACNSWGVEADRCDPLQRSVALAMI